MPTVILNDVELEAKVGERLLNVARRNAAHIGFVCDGNGICQTCQCRVLSGAQHLSPPSDAEQIWMPEHRIAAGHRLACQTTLQSEGRVRVLTSAEELRRQTLNLISPPAHSDRRDQLEPLLENLVRMNLDQVMRYPFNIIAALVRVGPQRALTPIRDGERWVDDLSRVTQRMVTGVERIERAPKAPRVHAPDDAPAQRNRVTRHVSSEQIHEERLIEAARALQRAEADLVRLRRR